MKYPWEQPELKKVWKNKAAFFNYLRSSLRRAAWNRHPIKIEYIKSKRFRIPNPNKRGRAKTVWGCKCEICKKSFPQKDIQVDHIIPAGSLRELKDIQGFIERLAIITFKNIRLVCKDCHAVITYAERKGISFTQSRAEAPLRTFLSKKAAEQKSILLKKGFLEKDVSNKTLRETAFRRCCLKNRRDKNLVKYQKE